MKKKSFIKTLTALSLALALCLSLNVSAFAAESCPEVTTETSTSEQSSVTPRSSISGYTQKTISGNDRMVIIDTTAEGIGGMGITIKTSCASGNYSIRAIGTPYPDCGSGSDIDRQMTTQDEQYWSNLWQSDLEKYVIVFEVPEGTPPFTVQVWIYG